MKLKCRQPPWNIKCIYKNTPFRWFGRICCVQFRMLDSDVVAGRRSYCARDGTGTRLDTTEFAAQLSSSLVETAARLHNYVYLDFR